MTSHVSTVRAEALGRPAVRLITISQLVVGLAVLAAAACSAPDANWDLRNYHLYNGYAFLNGRMGIDLAPAQIQTFNAPLLDTVYVLLLRALNGTPRLLSAALAVPHAIAAMLLLTLARRLLPPWPAFAAVLIGLTGAAALPTLAMTMGLMAPACCLLGAILLLVGDTRAELSQRASLGAGLLGGAAVGLQLTAAPYALGLAAMMPLLANRGQRLRLLVWLGSGGLIGAACVGGFWWWDLWRRYGDPVFPYFNGLFHSPWADPVSMTDRRFMPRSTEQALIYPLYWAFRAQTLVTELPTRDPRILLGWISALALAAGAARRSRGPDRVAAALPAFWAVSFVAWETLFSILRYLAMLELLSGVLVMLALRPVLRRLPSAVQHMSAAALAILVICLTLYPDWGRTSPGRLAVSVRPPRLPPGSLVVLLDPSPMAYVAAFVPPGIRFVGANNNLLHPGDRNRLARAVTEAISSHDGPLWGLEMPRESPGAADATLRAYGLRRDGPCVAVQSNLDDNGILACRLARTGAGATRLQVWRGDPIR